MQRAFTVTALMKKNIIASLLKLAGYIHSLKIFPGNIFGRILKNKMAATGAFFRLLARTFVGPVEQSLLQVEISNSQDIFLITKS